MAKLTKKGDLQNRINLKNESIDILKTELSGIVRRYDFQNVQEFYRAYQKAKNAYTDYKEQADNWENAYGPKVKSDSLRDRMLSYQEDVSEQQTKYTIHRKGRGRGNYSRPSFET